MDSRGHVWVACGETGYPERLLALQPAPAGVFVSGRLPSEPMLAIVGARAATARGLAFAAAVARQAASLGWTVVSGGAFGIDVAAHTAALDAGGQTVAVFGTGIDIDYPKRHRALFDRIAGSGALVSMLPLGSPPRSWHFPARNQLIAALADAVLVVEGKLRSGSLSTAAAARRLGRVCLALPGSPGTDHLIAHGALPLLDATELPRLLSPLAPSDGSEPEGRAALSPAAVQLHLALKQQPATLPELVERTALSVGECAELLFELESCGKAWRFDHGQYQARD